MLRQRSSVSELIIGPFMKANSRFYAALQQQSRIAFEKLFVVAVNRGQVEETNTRRYRSIPLMINDPYGSPTSDAITPIVDERFTRSARAK